MLIYFRILCELFTLLKTAILSSSIRLSVRPSNTTHNAVVLDKKTLLSVKGV